MKKKEIYINIKERVEDYRKKGIYTLFDSKFAREIFGKEQQTDETLNLFYNLLNEWDNEIVVPKSVGDFIEELIENESYFVGIHRTKVNHDIENNKLKSIMEKGLINYGDLSSGCVYETPKLSKTVSFCSTIVDAIITLKSKYNDSNSSILLVFPKAIVDSEGTITDENRDLLYNIEDGINYIKPEYVLGYFDCSCGVMNFFPKNEVLNKDNRINSI